MLELYKMPRKELQALCKQHSLPANKTNLAMADALSACLSSSSSSSTRRKATAKSQFLGVTKTTVMKARGEKKSDIPETSLASLILSGTLKSSSSSSLARRSTEKPSSIHSSSSGDRVLGFPQPNTTPLRRGLRKTDRQLYSIPEEKCHMSVTRSNMLGCKAPKRSSHELGGMTKEATTKSRKMTPLADISAGFNVSSAEPPTLKASAGVAAKATLLASNGAAQEGGNKEQQLESMLYTETEFKAIKPEQKNWVEVERPSSSPTRLEVENLDVYKELLGGGRLQVGSIASSTQSVTQTASECEDPLKFELGETQQQLKMETSVPQDFDVKTASPPTQFEDAKRGSAGGEEADKVVQGSLQQLESLNPAAELVVTNTALHEELLGIRDSKWKSEMDYYIHDLPQMEVLEMSLTADALDVMEDISRKPDDTEINLDYGDAQGLLLQMESVLPEELDLESAFDTFEDLLGKQTSDSVPMVDSVALFQTETVLPVEFDAQTATLDAKPGCVGEEAAKEILQDLIEMKSMKPDTEPVVSNVALHTELLGMRDSNGSAGMDHESTREPDILGLAQMESSSVTSSTLNALEMVSVPIEVLTAPAGISPLSRIQLQLDATIAKATGILSKYAEWKAESAAHTKIPGDSSQPEVANARNETSDELKQSVGGEMLVLDSTSRKERQILGAALEAGQLVHKHNSRHKDLEDTTLRKPHAHCKERKKQNPGVLKDIPLNVRLPKSKETPLRCSDKENPGHKGVKDLSLRKLRAHCKEEKVKALLRQSCID
ncbi:unnamed protein product [Sphagnum jensenii]|uniref:Uncharacterized protein n=1 Tax=Sphagnum jensenii TaxID=128206 RepID=A0ABP1BZT0_9BRYO